MPLGRNQYKMKIIPSVKVCILLFVSHATSFKMKNGNTNSDFYANGRNLPAFMYVQCFELQGFQMNDRLMKEIAKCAAYQKINKPSAFLPLL